MIMKEITLKMNDFASKDNRVATLSTVANSELESLSQLQRELHFTETLEDPISMNTHTIYVKTTWRTPVISMLKCTDDNADKRIYHVNPAFSNLYYTYLRVPLPSVEVLAQYKDTIQICWTHNILNNIIKEASFVDGELTWGRLDTVWLDMHHQFYQKTGAGKRKASKVGMGNVTCLEDWQHFLPKYTLRGTQPWYYSYDTAYAFRIYYNGMKTTASHCYSFELKVNKLLRMRQLVDGEWISVAKKNYKKYLTSNTLKTIPVPELWGRYSISTNIDIAWIKKNEEERNRTFYIKDVISYDEVNSVKSGEFSTIPLTSTYPCNALLWVAENKNAKDKNCHSNYTTDDDDVYAGFNPVKKCSLKYSIGGKWHNYDSDHFEDISSINHFPSSPYDQGYNAFSIADDSSQYQGDVGLCFGNLGGSLSCKIDSNTPFGNNKGKTKYNLRVRSMVTKKYQIIKQEVPGGDDIYIHVV